jgi:hypothetical protein
MGSKKWLPVQRPLIHLFVGITVLKTSKDVSNSAPISSNVSSERTRRGVPPSFNKEAVNRNVLAGRYGVDFGGSTRLDTDFLIYYCND